MRGLKFVAGLAALVALCGCDWGGTGDEGSWNDSYSWANFTGVYRSPSGGTIVNQNSNEPASTPPSSTGASTQRATQTFSAGSTSGTLSKAPVAGSVSITAKGTKTVANPDYRPGRGGEASLTENWSVTFADNGQGALVSDNSTYGDTGSINYNTGTWSIKLAGISPSSVVATYTFAVQGSAGANPSAKSSSANVMIYSFNVVQAGNKLTITDSTGTVYSGNITGASVPSDTTQSGNIRMSFEASAANGTKLTGAFNGDWSGTGTAGQGTLSNRLMEGTYVGKTSASIYAISGSVSLAAPVVSSNVPVVEANTAATAQ